jgi:pimeloyl-ACP methyl ester carboxylesterase
VTVLLVAGFGDAGDNWGAIAPAISSRSRVCSYTRFGLGASDRPSRDQTFETEAADLHALLRAAGEPGPYVVVGHSFGGAEAVMFAARYGEDVDGLLLLDASPPEWPAAVCSVPDDGSEMANGFRQTCDAVSTAGGNAERLDAVRAFAEVGAIRSLGDVPMMVATRADVTYPGLAAAADGALAQVWHAGQAHWASLSSSARLVTVAHSGHYLQIDQPAAVIDAIRSLVARRPQI